MKDQKRNFNQQVKEMKDRRLKLGGYLSGGYLLPPCIFIVGPNRS